MSGNKLGITAVCRKAIYFYHDCNIHTSPSHMRCWCKLCVRMHSPCCPQFGKTALDLAAMAGNSTCVSLLKQAAVGVKHGTGGTMVRPLMLCTLVVEASHPIRRHRVCLSHLTLAPHTCWCRTKVKSERARLVALTLHLVLVARLSVGRYATATCVEIAANICQLEPFKTYHP